MQQNPQGYGPPQGYPQQPQQKQGMSTIAKVLIALLVLGVCSVGGCLVCVGVGANAVNNAEQAKKDEVQKAKTAPAADVDLPTLLADYKANEVRADGLYKDKSFRVTGTVGDVKKGLGGGMYVTVGTGKPFEIPEVQCHLDEAEVAKASALKKGGKVTVSGRVTGLMMHVQMNPCSIL